MRFTTLLTLFSFSLVPALRVASHASQQKGMKRPIVKVATHRPVARCLLVNWSHLVKLQTATQEDFRESILSGLRKHRAPTEEVLEKTKTEIDSLWELHEKKLKDAKSKNIDVEKVEEEIQDVERENLALWKQRWGLPDIKGIRVSIPKTEEIPSADLLARYEDHKIARLRKIEAVAGMNRQHMSKPRFGRRLDKLAKRFGSEFRKNSPYLVDLGLDEQKLGASAKATADKVAGLGEALTETELFKVAAFAMRTLTGKLGLTSPAELDGLLAEFPGMLEKTLSEQAGGTLIQDIRGLDRNGNYRNGIWQKIDWRLQGMTPQIRVSAHEGP